MKKRKGSSQYHENPSKFRPIIVTFSGWSFSEDIKSTFSKAPENENRIYVSQMYSLAITSLRNDAMKKGRELKNEYKDIQGYVKYLKTLMIKKPGNPKYSVYQEF